MPKYEVGTPMSYVPAPGVPPEGVRIITGFSDGRYEVGPYYVHGREAADRTSFTEEAFERLYRPFGAGGDEKAAPDTVELDSLRAEVTSLNARLDSAVALNRKYSADAALIGSDLLDEAESRDWCGDYDNWVDDLNSRLSVIKLPTREKDFDVTLTYTVNVYTTVTARDSSHAVDIAYESFPEPGEVSYWSANWDYSGGDAEES